MPKDLGPEAKKEWRRIVPHLEEMGLLAAVDRGLLIRYCTVYADWMYLNALLHSGEGGKLGAVTKGSQGQPVRNPLWVMRDQAAASLEALGRQLGLSPSARLRLGIKHQRVEKEATADETRADAMHDRITALRQRLA